VQIGAATQTIEVALNDATPVPIALTPSPRRSSNTARTFGSRMGSRKTQPGPKQPVRARDDYRAPPCPCRRRRMQPGGGQEPPHLVRRGGRDALVRSSPRGWPGYPAGSWISTNPSHRLGGLDTGRRTNSTTQAEERFDAHRRRRPPTACTRRDPCEGRQQAARTWSNGSRSAGRSRCPRSLSRCSSGYGNKQIQLPIGLQLKDFQVDWNEGTDTPPASRARSMSWTGRPATS